MPEGGGAPPALGAEWELACADCAAAERREVDPREPVKLGVKKGGWERAPQSTGKKIGPERSGGFPTLAKLT